MAGIFAGRLKQLGLRLPIVVEANAASDDFIRDEICIKKTDIRKTAIILFISRIEREKGIYVAIDAVHILSRSLPVKLVVAGEEAAGYIPFITDLFLLSWVAGQHHHVAFSDAYKQYLHNICNYIHHFLDIKGNCPGYGDEDNSKVIIPDGFGCNNFISILNTAERTGWRGKERAGNGLR